MAAKDSCGPSGFRPTRALRSRALVTIVALLTGLLVGAGGVVLLLRPALVERRVRGERVLELERELAGASARLEAAERSFDARLAEAVRCASTEAFRDSGTRYLDAARGQLESTVAPLKQSLHDVGLVLLYTSVVFSVTSAYEYVALFADAVDAKNKRLGQKDGDEPDEPEPPPGGASP